MDGNAGHLRRWLTAIVLCHLAISLVHGAAHAGAQVPLSPAANLFVLVIVLAGPVVGLVLTRSAARIGMWVIGVTMTGSLLFGLVNHFLVASPDHVAHVVRQWQPLFTATAVLLALTEVLGCSLAFRLIGERRHLS
jgi:hypothetical protein